MFMTNVENSMIVNGEKIWTYSDL